MQKNIIEERIPTTMNMKQTFLYRALQREKGVRRQFLTELSRALATLGACGTASLATSQVFLEKGSLSTTAPVLLVLFLMLGSLHLLGLRQAHLLQALSDGVRASVRQKLHLHLLSRQGQTDRTLTRRLLPLALESTDALDAWFTRVLPVVQGIAITMPCLLIAAFLVDPMTGLLMLVTVPIAPFLLYLIGRVTRKASEEQWREMNRFSAGLAEILRALPTLKLFSREQAERERVRGLGFRPRAHHDALHCHHRRQHRPATALRTADIHGGFLRAALDAGILPAATPLRHSFPQRHDSLHR